MSCTYERATRLQQTVFYDGVSQPMSVLFSSTTKSAKRGFTLIELLVVIAIIAVLVAILLPAVQQAREAARRSTCKNNLKQIGIALHNYHDSHRCFPAGFYGRVTSTAGYTQLGNPGFSWSYMILPFMEQPALYEALDPNSYSITSTSKAPLAQTPLPSFRCPTDVGPELNANRSSYATSNYMANYGSRNITNYTTRIAGSTTAWGYYTSSETGMFSANSSCRMADIQDGTSNTVMIGELAYGPLLINGTTVDKKGSIWLGTVAGYVTSIVTLSGTTEIYKVNGSYGYGFSSMHSGGAQFVFADGSVHFLNQNMDATITDNLADRADGNVVGPF